MRIAEICPDCATYINASCILYDGEYLSNIDVSPLDSLDEILGDINTAFAAIVEVGSPDEIPDFIGQFYVNSSNLQIWVALSDTFPTWGLIGTLSTTSTTTTSP